MGRRAVVIAAVASALTCMSQDLDACGDKFLRLGQSARLKAYASIHPTSILVYQPATPDPKGVKAFKELLNRAGHTVVFVPHGTGIAQAVAAARYDLVITDYADAATLKEQLQPLPGRPDVLPMLRKSSKALAAQAEKEYHCLLTPDMTKYDALVEIDHAIELRLKAAASPGAPN